MAPGHAVTRSELFTDLYDAVATRRHAEHARAMTDSLLRADAEGYRLVGVTAAFDRAVFHESVTDRLVARGFDKHGLSGPVVDDSAEVARGVADPASWVATSPDTFGWVHPRYR